MGSVLLPSRILIIHGFSDLPIIGLQHLCSDGELREIQVIIREEHREYVVTSSRATFPISGAPAHSWEDGLLDMRVSVRTTTTEQPRNHHQYSNLSLGDRYPFAWANLSTRFGLLHWSTQTLFCIGALVPSRPISTRRTRALPVDRGFMISHRHGPPSTLIQADQNRRSATAYYTQQTIWGHF